MKDKESVGWAIEMRDGSMRAIDMDVGGGFHVDRWGVLVFIRDIKAPTETSGNTLAVFAPKAWVLVQRRVKSGA